MRRVLRAVVDFPGILLELKFELPLEPLHAVTADQDVCLVEILDDALVLLVECENELLDGRVAGHERPADGPHALLPKGCGLVVVSDGGKKLKVARE